MRKPDEFRDFPAVLAQRAPFGPYRAVIKRVTDGDTVDCMVDAGFGSYLYIVVRLWGVDAPELFSGDHRDAGAAARDHLASLIPPGSPVVLETERDVQSFGRYIARVWMADGREAGAVMIADGFAVPLAG